MSLLSVGFSGYDTSRSASDSIWSNCPAEQLAFGRRAGTFKRDDFETFSADGNIYDMVGDTAAVASAHDTGLVFMNCTNTDNNESYLGYGVALTGMAKMTGGGLSRVWFEARVKLSAIADQGSFVGLALPTYVAADMIANNTCELATTGGSLVGFRIEQADPNGWDAVYATAGTAVSVHKEAEATDAKYVPSSTSTYLQNAVADTYIKLGLHFDGSKCFWFVDGLKVNDTGVASSATNFPDGVNLTPVFGVKTGEAVAKALYVDWWQCAYQINS